MREKTASHILHVPFRRFPLWWLAPPPFPVGSMSLDSRVAGLPYESSSFATPRSSVGRQKESALMGRLGALLRPTWRSYAGPPQGTIKLRKAIFFIKWLYAKHGVFFPRSRGKSRAAGKREANAVSHSPECLSCYTTQKANPVTLTL